MMIDIQYIKISFSFRQLHRDLDEKASPFPKGRFGIDANSDDAQLTKRPVQWTTIARECSALVRENRG